MSFTAKDMRDIAKKAADDRYADQAAAMLSSIEKKIRELAEKGLTELRYPFHKDVVGPAFAFSNAAARELVVVNLRARGFTYDTYHDDDRYAPCGYDFFSWGA